jgi:putative membrane protein
MIGAMRFILRLLANMGALAVATWLLSGISLTGSTTGQKVFTLLIVALIFGIVNAIVKPIFTLVTAIVVLLTLGLFLIVINALMLLLTSWLSDQFNLGWSVDGFWTAVLGSIIISIVSFILNAFIPEKDEPRRRRD